MAFKIIIDNRTDVDEPSIIRAVDMLISKGLVRPTLNGMGYMSEKFHVKDKDDVVVCETDVSANGTHIFKFVTMDELDEKRIKRNKRISESAKKRRRRMKNGED